MGAGTVRFAVNGTSVELREVKHIPQLKYNLLSINAHTRARSGFTYLHDEDGCTMFKNKQKVTEVTTDPVDNLSKLMTDAGISDVKNKAMLSTTFQSAELWHRRFGHLGYGTLAQMAKQGMVRGMKTSAKDFTVKQKEICEPCLKGKAHRLPFPLTQDKATSKLRRLHADLAGPTKVASFGNARYFLVLTDQYTKLAITQPLQYKSEATEVLIDRIQMLECLTGERVKAVRTDNGGEFCNKIFDSYCRKKGITHEHTVPYSSEQNGGAERFIRTASDGIRSLLADSQMPKAAWAEALSHFTYVHNRSAFKDSTATPHELMFDEKPDVSHLRVFGCVAHMLIPKQKRSKLDERTERGRFVGYATDSKGWRILFGKQVAISHDVFFEEATANDLRASTDQQQLHEQELRLDDERDPGLIDYQVGGELDTAAGGDDQVLQEDAAGQEQQPHQQPDIQQPGINAQDQEADQQAQPRRSTRERQRPVEFWMGDKASKSHKSHNTAAVVQDLGARDYDFDELPSSDPLTVEEAMTGPDAEQWNQACLSELESFNSHKVWSVEQPPPGYKVLKMKWVFVTKRDAQGKEVRKKARLCVKGYEQQEGIDYAEIYAPSSRYSTIRTVIAVAVQNDYELHNMDIQTAFHYGNLDEVIYVEAPEGYPFEGNIQTAKLNNAVYGTKQGPREFQKVLSQHFDEIGFTQSPSDPTLYYKNFTDTDWVAVIHHVDDLLITGTSDSNIAQVKRDIKHRFEVRDFGITESFMNMAFERSPDTLKLHNQTAILQLLRDHNLRPESCRTHSIPISVSEQLSDEGPILDSNSTTRYRSITGALNYLAMTTRPDICQATAILSRFMQTPTEQHMRMAKGVLRYLAGTVNYGLVYHKSNTGLEFTAYADANYAGEAGEENGRRSTQGYVYLINGTAISWASQRQKTAVTSTAAAEYIAASEAAKEGEWLLQILQQLKVNITDFTLNVDNTSAIDIATNGGFSHKTKNLDVRYHYIKQLAKKQVLKLKYVQTKLNVADALTKAVPQAKHIFCRDGMGVHSK